MPAGATSLASLRRALKTASDPVRAVGVAGFFKTGPGEYGEGDKFLGITAPDLRRITRAHRDLARADALKLLRSRWHEERLAALMLMVDAHQRAVAKTQGVLRRDYLANTAFVNNWDLVDTSAPELVGTRVLEAGTRSIEKLAKSASLWERRIAIVATLTAIRADEFAPTLMVADLLERDTHDLIHKAVGWMLREVGKRDIAVLRGYLDAHAATMPRTSLRYAIERMEIAERLGYMARKKAASASM